MRFAICSETSSCNCISHAVSVVHLQARQHLLMVRRAHINQPAAGFAMMSQQRSLARAGCNHHQIRPAACPTATSAICGSNWATASITSSSKGQCESANTKLNHDPDLLNYMQRDSSRPQDACSLWHTLSRSTGTLPTAASARCCTGSPSIMSLSPARNILRAHSLARKSKECTKQTDRASYDFILRQPCAAIFLDHITVDSKAPWASVFRRTQGSELIICGR